jgi:hypothetical protein
MGNRIAQAVVIAGVAAVGVGAGSAANTRTQASPDVLAALLVEVRGLRVAMEQMASVGPRIDLALGRLQLQEQRVNTLLYRHADVRDRLAVAERESTHFGQQVEAMQTRLRDIADEKERTELQEALAERKQVLAMNASEVQRLRTEEVEAAQLLAAEQNRWTEINQRLEELERALTKR